MYLQLLWYITHLSPKWVLAYCSEEFFMLMHFGRILALAWKIPLPLIFFSFNQSLLPYLTWLKDCYFPHFCMVNKNMYSIFTPNQISGDTGHWTSSYIIKQNKLAAQAKSGRFIQVIDDYFIVVSLRITSRAGIF